MSRFFRLAVLLVAVAVMIGGGPILAASMQDDAGAVLFSDWKGGCTVGMLADLSCAIKREARSPSGELLGVVAFGEEDSSRYLFVEVELAQPSSGLSYVAKIDDARIANSDLVCRRDDLFCSATMTVDARLLRRLNGGRALTVENKAKTTALRFLLDGFAQARDSLL